MLVWVPDPVCQTLSGKWLSREPEITSSAASQIDATPGASLVARAKATAAKVAPKAGSPAKGKMAANSKKTPAMH